ncbi:copia protein, partial [Tanacetum coccineum]
MALSDPNWKHAMNDEFNALIENKMWELIPRKPNMHTIRSMWIFRHKLKSDGSFERYKARLVGDGRLQQAGVDCSETFSPVVKPATIRVVLSLALSKSWSIHQLDVKNAFLHGNLNYVSSIGFIHSKSDHSLFIYKSGRDIAYILLYVDDIILTASSDSLRQHIMKLLADEFAMKDLRPLSYFLGIAVSRTIDGLFFNQTKYAREILERAGMTRCKPSHTPVDTKAKLSTVVGSLVSDPTYFRSLAGALQYLTFTRPDISYAVQQICLHMHDPYDGHIAVMNRILRYIQGTLHYGLHLYKSSTIDMVSYTDVDWAGYPDARRSTSGYCVYLGDNLVSWSSKRQPTLSRSSAEAKYRGVANVVSESCWLRNLLLELQIPLRKATIVYIVI